MDQGRSAGNEVRWWDKKKSTTFHRQHKTASFWWVQPSYLLSLSGTTQTKESMPVLLIRSSWCCSSVHLMIFSHTIALNCPRSSSFATQLPLFLRGVWPGMLDKGDGNILKKASAFYVKTSLNLSSTGRPKLDSSGFFFSSCKVHQTCDVFLCDGAVFHTSSPCHLHVISMSRCKQENSKLSSSEEHSYFKDN